MPHKNGNDTVPRAVSVTTSHDLSHEVTTCHMRLGVERTTGTEPILAEPIIAEPILAEPILAEPILVWDLTSKHVRLNRTFISVRGLHKNNSEPRPDLTFKRVQTPLEMLSLN